jgi:large subunit ribosomal protein L3
MEVGMGGKSLKRLQKSVIGHLLKAGVPPKAKFGQFRVHPDNILPLGYQLGSWHFTPGQWVDVTGNSKGKGTQGAMQRWNFGGQPASHGVSRAHRSLGSTGMHTDPGKVFKGKKMHGRGGNKKRTVLGTQVYKIDTKRCLVYVKGMIPGPRGSIVRIRDAYWKGPENIGLLNYPTFLPDPKKRYADVLQMLPPKDDLAEHFIHDNALPKQATEDTGE